MRSSVARRLPKAQRRKQLLESARRIVNEQGTDVLTLGYLAERAGVSKPIAYEHFGSRSGLLVALYQQLYDQHVALLLQGLKHAPGRLQDVAEVIAAAYMHCCSTTGPEWIAIAAALKGDDTTANVQREFLDSYVALYCEALAPLAALQPDDLRLRCVAVIGAAEALSGELLDGRIDEATATASLASLIVHWLTPPS